MTFLDYRLTERKTLSLDGLTAYVGNTPLLPLRRVTRDLSPRVRVFAKAEWFSPGGSVKDRPALNIIQTALTHGDLGNGKRLLDSTSGNMGISYATFGAALGIPVTLAIPASASPERMSILRALGAELILTDPLEGSDGAILKARELAAEQPDVYWYANQYNNPANPEIHYRTTAQEILDDAGEGLAMVVISVGTGGAITGIARKLKEANPNIRIIGVDPHGSILGGGTDIYSYQVEGIGYDFFPKVLDNELVDEYVKTHDKESFLMARRLIREEGLLVGGSSGATVYGALQAAKRLKKGEKCVVILADGIRNYLATFVDDAWMKQNGFLD